MAVNGTYTHESNENFNTFLKAIGAKDERVEKMNSSKPTVTINLAGNKLSISSKGAETVENVLTIGSASTYTLAGGLELEVNLTQSGNNFSGTLTGGKSGKTGKVNVEFSATHLTETFSFGELSCKRIYKRT